MDNIEMEVGEFKGFTIHETFEQRQLAFLEGIRRDSLAVGAIPNPHALVKVPKMKIGRYLVHMMFRRGLPHGWGK